MRNVLNCLCINCKNWIFIKLNIFLLIPYRTQYIHISFKPPTYDKKNLIQLILLNFHFLILKILQSRKFMIDSTNLFIH